jgi:hypothetical protein
MPKRALHAMRRERPPRAFVSRRPSDRQQEACGNGHGDRAGRGCQPRLAGEGRLGRLDELGFRPEQRRRDAVCNAGRSRPSNRGQEPEGDGGSDALGDKGTKESRHHRSRHASLDAAERARRCAVADREEHRVRSQVADALERLAQICLDDDRVGLAQ